MPSATRSSTSSETRSTTRSSPRRSAWRRASPPPARSSSPPATPAANVVITVRDDGRGIDPELVAARAAERGLIPRDAVDTVDMARAIELLFTPGFSTAETTSDISGRGVGMDAVRNAIRGLGGAVVMTSELGAGVDRADPPAADARDRPGPARRVARDAVRDPARAGRAHREPRRADRALGDRPADARAERRRAPADRPRRGARVRPAPDAGYVVIVRGARPPSGPGRRTARRPARAGHAAACPPRSATPAPCPAAPSSPTARSPSSSTATPSPDACGGAAARPPNCPPRPRSVTHP